MSQADLLAPYTHIADVPGKGFRTSMIDAFNLWVGCPARVTDGLKEVVHKLHNASLLVDDIEDSSQLRRGVPVAHAIYGVPLTLNAANYVYFLAMQEALALSSDPQVTARAVRVLVDEMVALHRGQGQDIHYRDSNIVPTEEQYAQMVSGKTSGLFRLTVRLMQALTPAGSGSESQHDFAPLLDQMGLYFQILDDYLNLKSGVYHHNKSFCEDITEGKWSFPILHSVHVCAARGDTRLRRIVRQRTDDVELKKYCLSIIEDTGSFEYTARRIGELYAGICAAIDGVGAGNPALRALIGKLHAQLERPAGSDAISCSGIATPPVAGDATPPVAAAEPP